MIICLCDFVVVVLSGEYMKSMKSTKSKNKKKLFLSRIKLWLKNI